MLLGALLLILVVAGLVYFFGNVIRWSLSGKSKTVPHSENSRKDP